MAKTKANEVAQLESNLNELSKDGQINFIVVKEGAITSKINAAKLLLSQFDEDTSMLTLHLEQKAPIHFNLETVSLKIV